MRFNLKFCVCNFIEFLTILTVLDAKRFVDEQILPIIWMELSSGNISEELRTAIYHSTFSANAIQLTLRYGTLLVCVTTLAMLIGAVYYRNKAREMELQHEHGDETKKTNISVSE